MCGRDIHTCITGIFEWIIRLEGRLIGHSSMVTAVQEITGTEMVVSADD